MSLPILTYFVSIKKFKSSSNILTQKYCQSLKIKKNCYHSFTHNRNNTKMSIKIECVCVYVSLNCLQNTHLCFTFLIKTFVISTDKNLLFTRK